MEKYLPYTEAEYKELKEVINSIGAYIPHDRMGWVWSNHNKISKTNEVQPCSCGSAASHWKRAVDNIRNFITNVEKND
jgi:hypothetical protein